jgi:hypothetical protein
VLMVCSFQPGTRRRQGSRNVEQLHRSEGGAIIHEAPGQDGKPPSRGEGETCGAGEARGTS